MSGTEQMVREQIRQRQQSTRQSATPDGFYGPLTGKYYDSVEARNYYELREAQHRGVDPTDMLLEGLSTDQIRALDQRARLSEQEKVDMVSLGEDLLTFHSLHPEYEDFGAAGEENKKVMLAHFRALRIKHPTLAQLEDAYQQLKANDLLHLNQAELQKQTNKQAQERARKIQARGGVAAVAANEPTETEEELETMPLAEIRRRATAGGWHR
jgi:hypothetical protein